MSNHQQFSHSQNALQQGYPGMLSGLSSGTTTATSTTPYYTYPFTPEPLPSKLEVPVYDADSKQGILIRDKKGELVYVPIAKIVDIIGITW